MEIYLNIKMIFKCNTIHQISLIFLPEYITHMVYLCMILPTALSLSLSLSLCISFIDSCRLWKQGDKTFKQSPKDFNIEALPWSKCKIVDYLLMATDFQSETILLCVNTTNTTQ